MEEENEKVHFYFKDVNEIDWDFVALEKWVLSIADAEKKIISEMTYIFCTDEYLHEINVEYLQHDTLTDIITFDLSTDSENFGIEAEIYISIKRVNENADKFQVSLDNEISRVIAHGILHLCGYNDEADEEIATMRGKESFYMQISPLVK
ncbi:MAG: rRNA maturation RNase YbeY [Chitinophagales bacterium]|nr:rRNA maturation RNase YbeY [Chitinophagales bacterium]